MRVGLRKWQCAVIAAMTLTSIMAPAAAERTRFAVIGDLPYFAWEELRLEQMLDAMNAEPLAFVLHVGDIKSGHDACSDALYLKRKVLFDRSAHPLVLLPGDNDWTDCHRASAGGFDPVERLAHLRRMFHGGDHALGQRPMQPERRTGYPENMRWELAAVVFVAVHDVGSHNGLGRNRAGDAEYAARNAANLEWLAAAFAHAQQAGVRGVVVAFHANPNFERPAGSRARMGHDDLVRALAEQARAFAGPVLVIHGDTHTYRVTRPLVIKGAEDVGNLSRLESFGSPATGWVRVTIDSRDPALFVIEPAR
jgi:hypothetical protein